MHSFGAPVNDGQRVYVTIPETIARTCSEGPAAKTGDTAMRKNTVNKRRCNTVINASVKVAIAREKPLPMPGEEYHC